MIEQMDKTLIEKLKEVIQQHTDLTGERAVSLHAEWVLFLDGNSQLVKININVEK